MSKLRNPKYPCTQTPSLLAGGCYRGLVCWWDERAGGLAAGHSEFEQSHSDVVYTLRWAVLGAGRGQGTSLCCDRWIGKTGHEFFTGSSDGYIKWWDIRCDLQPGIVLVITGVWCLVAGTSPRQSGSTAWSRASARTRTSRQASTASVSSPPSQASSWWGPSRAALSSAGQQCDLIGGELVT